MERRSLKKIKASTLKPWLFQASSFQLLKLENLLRWSFFSFLLMKTVTPGLPWMPQNRNNNAAPVEGVCLYLAAKIFPIFFKFSLSTRCRHQRIVDSWHEVSKSPVLTGLPRILLHIGSNFGWSFVFLVIFQF